MSSLLANVFLRLRVLSVAVIKQCVFCGGVSGTLSTLENGSQSRQVTGHHGLCCDHRD